MIATNIAFADTDNTGFFIYYKNCTQVENFCTVDVYVKQNTEVIQTLQAFDIYPICKNGKLCDAVSYTGYSITVYANSIMSIANGMELELKPNEEVKILTLVFELSGKSYMWFSDKTCLAIGGTPMSAKWAKNGIDTLGIGRFFTKNSFGKNYLY